MSERQKTRSLATLSMENGRMVIGTKVTVAGALGGLLDVFGPSVSMTHLGPERLMTMAFQQVGNSLRHALNGARERFR